MATEHTLDVRPLELIQRFGTIFEKLSQLGAEDSLLLVNDFEPLPLYGELGKQGFQYESRQVAEGEWHITIKRKP
jgi:uncharacterized protein (DUF2249 family)